MEINRAILEVISTAIRARKIYESDKGFWVGLASHKPEKVREILFNLPVNAIDLNNTMLSEFSRLEHELNNIQTIVNYPTMQNERLNDIANIIDKAITNRKILARDRASWLAMTKRLMPYEVVDLVNSLPMNAIDGNFKPSRISDVMSEISKRTSK